MTVTIDKGEPIDVKHLKITIDGADFRILEAKFEPGIVINKYTMEDCTIMIVPRVSNEIEIR